MSKGKKVPVFTVRDMNRSTAQVLEASQEYGSATIRSRSGQEYKITPVHKPKLPLPSSDFMGRLKDHQKKLKEMGACGPATNEGMEKLNRIIAGEECRSLLTRIST